MFLKTLALCFLAFTPAFSFAATVEKWRGSGAEFDAAGKQLGTYEITLINTIEGVHVHSEATITTADGARKVITQELTMRGTSWSNRSSLGIGGGACYGPDLCENYIVGNGAYDYATTIISDGPQTRRTLTFVLPKSWKKGEFSAKKGGNGKPAKVLREKLVRTN